MAPDFADDILKRHSESSTEDLLATLTRFTAESIKRSLVQFVLPRTSVARIIASGRGTGNITLMKMLAAEIDELGLSLVLSDETGIPAAYKEAVKFCHPGACQLEAVGE